MDVSRSRFVDHRARSCPLTTSPQNRTFAARWVVHGTRRNLNLPARCPTRVLLRRPIKIHVPRLLFGCRGADRAQTLFFRAMDDRFRPNMRANIKDDAGEG